MIQTNRGGEIHHHYPALHYIIIKKDLISVLITLLLYRTLLRYILVASPFPFPLSLRLHHFFLLSPPDIEEWHKKGHRTFTLWMIMYTTKDSYF